MMKKVTINTTSSKTLLKSSLCEERGWLLHHHSTHALCDYLSICECVKHCVQSLYSSN